MNQDPNDDLELHEHEPGERVPAPLFHVVLVEPEIPQNTGNIGRTCVGSRADLQLVGKLGFKITDKNLKRAGLDYWQHLRWKHISSYESWTESVANPKRVFYFSTKATKKFYEVEFQEGDSFVFGKETKGLDLLSLNVPQEQLVKIPMYGPIRSFNVATAVNVVLFEALRQLDLKGIRIEP